jgi:uncharacterized protein
MTSQERDLILAVAQRLRGTSVPEKDYEAERLIQNDIGSQPDALYRLTQAVIVQEQGLRHAQERIQQLEAQLQAAQEPRHGDFLSNLLGGGSPAPPSAPYGASSPAPSPGGGGAGNFLRSAAATAAGVAGGQLIYDGLRQMFGGSSFPAGMGGGFLANPSIVTNVYDQDKPGQNETSVGAGGSWTDDNDSAHDAADNDDSLSEGGDFDTDSDDDGDHDDSDSF